MERPCGNPECSVSTGIHEGLTFGSGHLDSWGFWSVPCQTCAREAEQRDGVEPNTYWPWPHPVAEIVGECAAGTWRAPS